MRKPNVRRFPAIRDLIVAGHESADAGGSGRPAYAAFANLGLLHAEIVLEVQADGRVRAEDCRIEFVDRFAAEEAEEGTDAARRGRPPSR